MKIQKILKISILILSSLFIFSCASKQIPEDISKEDIQNLIDSYEENESSDASKNKAEVMDAVESEKEEIEKTLEPLTEEQNPELPALPEIQENTEENPPLENIPEPEVTEIKIDSSSPEKAVSETEKSEETKIKEEVVDNKKEINQETKTPAEKENNSDSENESSSENENSSEDEDFEAGKVNIIPNPSRSITIQKNQLIDILYPGKGWIYQGNIDAEGNLDSRNKNFIFGGRKLGGSDTAFTLRSRVSGTYLLHFFKNDVLTGNYIDDYLEVIVQDKNTNSTDHIKVPDYAEVVPPKAVITAEKIKEEKQLQKLEKEAEIKKSEEKKEVPSQNKKKESTSAEKNTSPEKDSSINTIIQTTESAPSPLSPVIKSNEVKKAPEKAEETTTENKNSLQNMNEDQLLTAAQKYYDEKDYPEAFNAITKFFDKATKRLDEGLYLQGRILEEKSPVQNIKDAIESYDLVVNNYPSSALWDKANKRSIFLKRFYINIR